MNETDEHADLISLFARNPRLAARFGTARLPRGYTVRIGKAVYRGRHESDALILVRDARGKVVLAVVLEVQRSTDPGKKMSWSVYMWLVRALYACEVRVLVFTTSRRVATWARRPICNGPGSVTRVTVVGPDEFPRIVDPAVARADPAVAALSAAMHADAAEIVEIQRAAVAAVRDLPRAELLFYCSLIFRGKDLAVARRLFEELMQKQPRRREKNGFWEYLAWLEARGESHGETAARVEILLRLLKQRGIPVDRDSRARIRGCDSIVRLDRWIDRVLTVRRASELFVAPRRRAAA